MALRQDGELFPLIAGGGDDYEILFAAPPEKGNEIEAAAGEASVRVTKIGRVTGPNEGVTLVDGAGRAIPLKQLGYSHF